MIIQMTISTGFVDLNCKLRGFGHMYFLWPGLLKIVSTCWRKAEPDQLLKCTFCQSKFTCLSDSNVSIDTVNSFQQLLLSASGQFYNVWWKCVCQAARKDLIKISESCSWMRHLEARDIFKLLSWCQVYDGCHQAVSYKYWILFLMLSSPTDNTQNNICGSRIRDQELSHWYSDWLPSNKRIYYLTHLFFRYFACKVAFLSIVWRSWESLPAAAQYHAVMSDFCLFQIKNWAGESDTVMHAWSLRTNEFDGATPWILTLSTTMSYFINKKHGFVKCIRNPRCYIMITHPHPSDVSFMWSVSGGGNYKHLMTWSSYIIIHKQFSLTVYNPLDFTQPSSVDC